MGCTDWLSEAKNRETWRITINRKHLHARHPQDQPNKTAWAAAAVRSPSTLIGLRVQKIFHGVLYRGYIYDADVDANNNDVLWGVHYNDGDRADYNLHQLLDLLLSSAQ